MKFLEITTASDEDLMHLLQQGNHDALALLFDRHYRLVLNVALKILGDRGEAEDLMQDVFFEIYRKAGHFDPARGNLKAWLLQYAYHRSLNRRQYLKLRNFYGREQIPESHFLDGWRVSSNGWGGLTSTESSHLVRQGLRTLNPKQRQTLELVCFQGLLLGDIAERMKEPLPNVRHHYYRGLKKLKEFLLARPRPALEAVRASVEAIDAGR